jgi:hypothetical protein
MNEEQGYKTLDGFILKEGEGCFVSLSCLTGDHKLSTKPRPAFYMDATAEKCGWDFTTKYPMQCDCEDTEVTHVWKFNPELLKGGSK